MNVQLNKKSKSVIAVYAIILVVYILAFLIIPFNKNAASWISFFFTIIAIAGSLFVCGYAFNAKQTLVSKIYGYPVFRVGVVYALVQLVLGIIICAISAFAAVPYWVALLLSVILLAAATIGVIITDNTRDFIEETEAEDERVTNAIKLFNLNIAAVVDLCTDATVKKELEKLAESFRFSDPVSSDATEDIENTIMEKLESLKIGISSSAVEENIAKTTELKTLLAERNRICKMSKR